MTSKPVEDPTKLRAHYELERRLARRLRDAGAEERPALYARVYEELHRELDRLELGYRIESNPPGQTRLLLALLGPLLSAETVFLDFGAGNGALARAVAPEVRRVVAVDDHPDLAVVAEEVANLEVAPPDRLAERLEPGSVDLALSCHVVEHLHPDDLHPHLLQIHDLLRPGGRYVLVTPNRLLGPHDISRFFSSVPEGLHLHEYDYRELAAAVRRAGFERVTAIRGLGARQTEASVGLFAALEKLLEPCPRGLRQRMLSALGSPPLRPLEQVKLVALR